MVATMALYSILGCFAFLPHKLVKPRGFTNSCDLSQVYEKFSCLYK